VIAHLANLAVVVCQARVERRCRHLSQRLCPEMMPGCRFVQCVQLCVGLLIPAVGIGCIQALTTSIPQHGAILSVTVLAAAIKPRQDFWCRWVPCGGIRLEMHCLGQMHLHHVKTRSQTSVTTSCFGSCERMLWNGRWSAAWCAMARLRDYSYSYEPACKMLEVISMTAVWPPIKHLRGVVRPSMWLLINQGKPGTNITQFHFGRQHRESCLFSPTILSNQQPLRLPHAVNCSECLSVEVFRHRRTRQSCWLLKTHHQAVCINGQTRQVQ